MKLYIDTCNFKSMRVELNEEEDTSLAACIEELAFGMAGLSMKFLVQEMKTSFSQGEVEHVKEHIVKLYSLILDQAFKEEIQ